MRDSKSDDSVYPDPCPNLEVERGPQNDGVGIWVPTRKHRLLRDYLIGTQYAWKKWPNRVFIDPFCGPGRIQVKGEQSTRDGGAAVAWRALSNSTPFTKMLIGDLKPDRAAACEQRLRALGAPVTSFVGKAVDTVKLMVATVPRGSLCMAYIDPYNLELLSFAMFRELAALRNVDLAINFSTMDLKRNSDMELDPERARFDDAAPGWRKQPFAKNSNKRNLSVGLFNYWFESIKGLGFKSSQEIPLVPNDRGHEIYRLAFFARHKFPIGLWDDVAKDRNRSFDFGE